MKGHFFGIAAVGLIGCGGGGGGVRESDPSLSPDSVPEPVVFQVSLERVIATRDVDGAPLDVDVSGIQSEPLSLSE